MLSPIPFLLVIFCIYGCKAFVYNCTYSCGDVSCPPVTTTGQRKCKNMYLDHCGCCAYCAKSEGDKCGGKMNLWGSCEPGFECTYRSGSVYNEERFGFCEHVMCSSLVCGYRQRCTLSKQDHKVPMCVCPRYHCHDKINPVCGYDGSTYTSVCELQQAECTRGTFIGINHFGACNTVPSTLPTSTDDPPPSGWIIDSLIKPIECIFDGKVYLPGQPVDNNNICLNISCTNFGVVVVVPIPGCGDNKPERDYHVDLPPVYNWSGWSSWSECSCDSMTQSRSRSCVLIQYEGVTKTNCTSIDNEVRPCACPL